MNAVLLRRRLAVAHSAAVVIGHGRRVELSRIPAVARVAILVEAAGALAALARKQACLSHVDVQMVAALVTDPADAFAVLGRGRWLPTMHRPVWAIPARVPVRRVVRRSRTRAAGQLCLFSTVVEGR